MNRLLTGTLITACLLATAAAAAPRYELALLPEAILAGNGSHNRVGAFRSTGGLQVAIGSVNGAVQAEVVPWLWFRKGGGAWRSHPLSDLGHGGSASSFWLGSNDALGAAVVGTVKHDADEDFRAALWTLQRTRRGWTDTLVPLEPPGGGDSEATSIVESIDFPSYIVGHKEGIAPGSTVAALWDIHQACTILPAPSGGNAEAIAGVELPNGDLRVVGCLEVPAGSGLEFAVEWTGNPQEGFVAQLLPEPGLGLQEYHVLAVDPLLRYAVGARIFPGGTFEPAGWAGTGAWPGILQPRTPTRLGQSSFNPLPIPSSETGVGRLYAVNSSGRALGDTRPQAGVNDGEDFDNWTFVMRVNVPEPDSRRVRLSSLVDNDSNSLGFRGEAISEHGVVSGSVEVAGRRRPCLLVPTSVEAPDLVRVEGWEDDVEVADLVWDDTDIVHINDQTPADWNELRAEIDGTRFFDIPSEFHGGLNAAARRRGPAILATVRLEGPKTLAVRQRLRAWNFQTQQWSIIADIPGHCGLKFRRLQIPLPSAIGPYLSPAGSLRIGLSFTPANGTGDALNVSVNSVSLWSFGVSDER